MESSETYEAIAEIMKQSMDEIDEIPMGTVDKEVKDALLCLNWKISKARIMNTSRKEGDFHGER